MDTLIKYLDATLVADNAVRKAAETELWKMQQHAGYLPALLQVAVQGPTINTRLAASLMLKNCINRNWARTEVDGSSNLEAVFTASDKAQMRANIIAGILTMDQKTILTATCDAAVAICHADFPDKWPELLPALVGHLKSDNPLVMHNVLLVIRKIAKRYEYRSRAKWGPMVIISDATMPIIFNVFQQLLKMNTEMAATLMKIIVKIFWSVTAYQLAKFTQSRGEAMPWFVALHTLLAKPLPEASTGQEPKGQPVHEEDRNEWPWWKAKKHIVQVLGRLFSRYGSLEHIPKDEKEERAFARLFTKEIGPAFMPTIINLVKAWASGTFVTKKVIVCCMSILADAVDSVKTYKFIKPHLEFLLCNVVAPVCSFSKEDAELWEHDPEEYIRLQHDPMVDATDVRLASMSFLVDSARFRAKNAMPILNAFWNKQLSAYNAAAPSARNYPLKAGIMTMIDALADVLKSRKKYATKLEAMLIKNVLPEFDSPMPYLRARACQLYSRCADLPFKDENNLKLAVSKMLQCLDPKQHMVVRFTCGVALCEVIRAENPYVDEVVSPHIQTILMALFGLINELPVDEIVTTVGYLIERFGPLMLDIVVPMGQQLAALFVKFWGMVQGDDDEEGTAGMTAMNCLETITTLLPLLGILDTPAKKMEYFTPLEAAILPILNGIFNEDGRGLELCDLGCDLFEQLTYVAPRFTAGMWQTLMLLIKAFHAFAMDYIGHMVKVIEGFIVRDNARFLAGDPSRGLNFVNMCGQIVQKCIADGNEDDRAHAMELLLAVLHNFPGKVDAFAQACIVLVATEMQSARKDSYKVALSEVLASLMFYNNVLTIQGLEARGVTAACLNVWFAMLPTHTTATDNKIAALGLCALMRLDPATQQPKCVKDNLHHILKGVVERLRKIHENEEEDTDDEDEDESDDDDDDEEVGDDEEDEYDPDKGDEEDADADVSRPEDAAYFSAIQKAAEKARKAAESGHMLPPDEVYEDDTDDDEDEEEEEEADDESGLGKVKELQYFRDTLKAYASLGDKHKVLLSMLPAPLQQTCQRLVTKAEAEAATLTATATAGSPAGAASGVVGGGAGAGGRAGAS